MRLKALARLTWTIAFTVTLIGCGSIGQRGTAVPAMFAEDDTADLVAFGNRLYAMSDAERLSVYSALRTESANSDTSRPIRLALAAQSMEKGSAETDPVELLRAAAAAGGSAPNREFAMLLAHLISDGRSAANAQSCAALSRDARTLRKERDSERARCAALEAKIEGLLRLESEMSDRTIEPVEPVR